MNVEVRCNYIIPYYSLRIHDAPLTLELFQQIYLQSMTHSCPILVQSYGESLTWLNNTRNVCHAEKNINMYFITLHHSWMKRGKTKQF